MLIRPPNIVVKALHESPNEILVFLNRTLRGTEDIRISLESGIPVKEVLVSSGKEEGQFEVLGNFLNSLKEAKEGDQSILDRTMVLYGTCMGSANSHSNVNLPVLLAGGGFKHGQHLAFDTKNNYPLTNLFVSMLQRLGIEVGEFSTGKGTMKGLELVRAAI